MMTAPLKNSGPTTVEVALGDRAYDIVIGRDQLGSLGSRIAALRPGARTAIVTDRTVAKHWLAQTETSLLPQHVCAKQRQHDEQRDRVPQRQTRAQRERRHSGSAPVVS